MAPFVVIGVIILISATVTALLLPDSDSDGTKKVGSITGLLKDFGVMLFMFTVFVVMANMGFTDVALGLFLEQFHLGSRHVGLVFLLVGASYGLTMPFWGVLGDKCFQQNKMVAVSSSIVIIGLVFLGPLPFIPIRPSLPGTLVSLFVYGTGMAMQEPASFAGAQKEAIQAGYPDDMSTSGLVSGVWTASFSLRAFVGPSVTGFLLERYGFRYCSLFFVGLNLCLLLLSVGHLVMRRRSGNPSSRPLLKESSS